MPDIPILGESDEILEDEGEGAVLLKGLTGKVWDIDHTNLADGHAPRRHIQQELEETGTYMGEGFIQQDIPVLVQRNMWGGIVRTTPLNELPGVDYTPGGLKYLTEPEVQEEVATPSPIGRSDRHKLVKLLALRLFKYYKAMPPEQQKYNPFYDGLPDLPAGSPEHLQPLPGTPLYPASDSQIMEWFVRFIGDRVQVINKNKFGKDNLQDLALRIE